MDRLFTQTPPNGARAFACAPGRNRRTLVAPLCGNRMHSCFFQILRNLWIPVANQVFRAGKPAPGDRPRRFATNEESLEFADPKGQIKPFLDQIHQPAGEFRL